MKGSRRFQLVFAVQLILVPVFTSEAFAQPGSRRMPADTRRQVANDTFRELMKAEREHPAPRSPENDADRIAALKQLRADFKSIQDINNKMMAEAWAQESIDYERTSRMLNEINDRATRLRSSLALPQLDKIERRNLSVGGLKEFKSALLLMDRSLMDFVNNPIFQRNVVEVNLAAKAARDLENVIAYSANLKKIAANLKKSSANRL